MVPIFVRQFPGYLTFNLRLTKEQAELFYKASQGKFPCPRCGKPMQAEVYYCQEDENKKVYSNITLNCDLSSGKEGGCGYWEH